MGRLFLKNAGIIAEYNPFHTGHLWQIDELRRLGAKTVTIALGGDFCQRGRPAAFSKFARAKAALLCGADLVVELPLPFCCASAEQFACGGVSVLSALGCVDTLCFGAEDADIPRLLQLANVLIGEDYTLALKEELLNPVSFPVARAAALNRLLPNAQSLLQQPNNILGIEYLKAMLLQKSNLRPLAVARQGAAHDAPVPQDGFASASALRKAIADGDEALLENHLPAAAAEVFAKERSRGAVTTEEAFFRSLLTVLRTLPADAFKDLPSGGEGLENLLCSACQKAGNAEELYSLLKSKRYTHARVRRLALEAYLGISSPLPYRPAYLRVLGASEAGLSLLSHAKEKAGLPVVFSLAQAARLDAEDAKTQAALSARAGALFGLCCETIQPSDAEFRQKFIRV